MNGEAKGVIACDREGRIEGFDPAAERMFGYGASEVVGRKRLTAFFPGHVAAGHVGTWMKKARGTGTFRSTTVLLRKGGEPFAADLEITPVFRGEEHVGFRGVTVPKPEARVEEVMPDVGPGDRILRWVVILRLPFLTASLVAVVIGGAWAAFSHPGFAISPWIFALVLVAGGAIHTSANAFNDYFDWESGTDSRNNDYFSPYTGGSRAIDLGLIDSKGLLRVAVISFVVPLSIAALLIALGRTALIYFGLFGACSSYFYTAPPLRLAARRGMGELLIGMSFGVVMVAGTVYALTGSVGWVDFWIGAPIGLLTIAILWVNQFPDMASDAAAGKRNLVVVLGKKKACFGYAGLLGGAFFIQAALVMAGILPRGALWVFLTLPIAIQSSRIVFRSYDDRALVAGCRLTILLQLLFGLAAAAGTYWS
jgi:1,4-dihydroxy-2-naphthoate polyprenyltransferase